MIVVLLIGILITIAIPNFIRARERSQQKTCLSNLRQLSDAKSIFAMEARLSDGDPVEEADIFPTYIRGDGYPECPLAGDYAFNEVGEPVTCTKDSGDYPHVLEN